MYGGPGDGEAMETCQGRRSANESPLQAWRREDRQAIPPRQKKIVGWCRLMAQISGG